MVNLFVSAVVVFTVAQAVAAFDVNQCTGFSFFAKDRENLINSNKGYATAYYCGTLPPDQLYVDDTGYGAWTIDNKWCDFLVNAVRKGGNSLAPEVALNRINVPNGGPLQMWACYITNASGTNAYVVNYRGLSSGQQLPTAQAINTVASRTKKTFDTSVCTWLPANFRGNFNPSYTPKKVAGWEQCYFNNVQFPGFEHRECSFNRYCEYKNQWWSTCLEDPRYDHECCISPHGRECKSGECCIGFFCDTSDSTCKRREWEPNGGPSQVYKGICSNTTATLQVPKIERTLWSRCSQWSNETHPKQGDCAFGHLCIGSEYAAECQPNRKLINECNLEHWETGCRPGDCAAGWRCKVFFNTDGTPSWSQCRPGPETLTITAADGTTAPVHDGLCRYPDAARSYKEKLGTCTGAVCNVWGDPHIVSCDNKKWDCQAAGLFVLMSNFMFQVQAHFTQMNTILGTSASITDAVAIDFKGTTVPTVQFSFPKFVTRGEKYDTRSKVIGSCPVLFYVDGVMMNISTSSSVLYDAKNVTVRIRGSNYIMVEYREPTRRTNVTMEIQVGGGGPFTDWGCIFSTSICLPEVFETEFRSTTTGLLGTPDGNNKNDWIRRNGTIATYGWGKDAFDFCMNWCVNQTENIMVGSSYAELKCDNQVFQECGAQQLMEKNITEAKIFEFCCKSETGCVPTDECRTELCITGLTPPTPIVPLGDKDNETALVVIDDCSNLGAFVSQSTGIDRLPAASYLGIKSCLNPTTTQEWMVGWDSSVSVLVGKSYKCINGTGVEGNMVVNKNFIVDKVGVHGCSSFVSTTKGACVVPPKNTPCIQVGGDVSIGSSNEQRVSIMGGSTSMKCDLAYAGSCSVGDNSTCPSTSFGLADKYVNTGGQALKLPNLDLSSFRTTLTILAQKQQFWKDYAPLVNNVKDTGTWAVSSQGTLTLTRSAGNSCVQVFNFPNGWPAGVQVLKFDQLDGKTVLINVGGTNTIMAVPFMEDQAGNRRIDAGTTTQASFSTKLITSTVWNFYGGGLTITGDNPFLGSIVVKEDLNMQASAHLGRTLVLGNLIQNRKDSTMYNYPFDPQCPLPLPPSGTCTVAPETPCSEAAYKVLTSKSACPNAPGSFEAVKLVKRSSGTLLPPEDVIYGIQMEVPQDGGAPFVSFKVDNPFPDLADMYVKYEKPVGKYALDPACKHTSMVKDCEPVAERIQAGCVAHEGVDPYALVTVYFASDSTAVSNQGLATTIDKCCHPEEYDKKFGFGVVSYTFEIKCACPTASGVTSQ